MLKLPDKADRPITLSFFAWSDRDNAVSLGFQTELYDGPWKQLGSITVSPNTLYRLLLTLREND